MNASEPLPRVCGRTVLRRIADSDLARFQAYRTDPEVARLQGWETLTDSEAMSFIRGTNAAEFLAPGQWSQIGIADRPSGFLIGDIGIRVDPDEHEAEIGFSLDRGHQRRGLGWESVHGAMNLIFERTRVGRIIGVTDERNLASINLLEALGMKQTSTLDTVFRGERCTELTFAVPRNRFQER